MKNHLRDTVPATRAGILQKNCNPPRKNCNTTAKKLQRQLQLNCSSGLLVLNAARTCAAICNGVLLLAPAAPMAPAVPYTFSHPWVCPVPWWWQGFWTIEKRPIHFTHQRNEHHRTAKALETWTVPQMPIFYQNQQTTNHGFMKPRVTASLKWANLMKFVYFRKSILGVYGTSQGWEHFSH